LKNHGVEIHARSVFLQGLLLMPLKNTPPWFDPIKETLELFHKEAKKRNMSVLQLALSFVQSIDEIDKVIVGVNTLRQLQEVVSAASIRVNTTELSYISIDDPAFINPVNWKT
jgi:aryl-alcohol dehydrogenase-like predicted oxidoreductase